MYVELRDAKNKNCQKNLYWTTHMVLGWFIPWYGLVYFVHSGNINVLVDDTSGDLLLLTNKGCTHVKAQFFL